MSFSLQVLKNKTACLKRKFKTNKFRNVMLDTVFLIVTWNHFLAKSFFNKLV